MNLFLYTMSHFLSKLLRKLYLVTHWEWAWLFCTGENSQHGSAAYLPRGRCMVILCSLCAVYRSFCASSIKLCTPGCSTVLSWLHLQVRSKRTQIHMLLFFHKDETIMHLPHDMQQSMHYTATFKTRSQHLCTGCSNGQHWDQYSIWNNYVGQANLVQCIGCVPTCAQKAFNFEL